MTVICGGVDLGVEAITTTNGIRVYHKREDDKAVVGAVVVAWSRWVQIRTAPPTFPDNVDQTDNIGISSLPVTSLV